MNNREVERALRDQHVRVICADELASPGKDRPKTFIVNTDPCSRPGTHWTAFHFPSRGPSEFFDSLGHRPGDYDSRFEGALGSRYLYTPDAIQPDDSDTCGAYCIYFASQRHRSRSFQDILNAFSTVRLRDNDRKVKKFIRDSQATPRRGWSARAARTVNDGK